MRKRILIAIIALGFLGILGFGALAWRPAIAPIGSVPSAFASELVSKGATVGLWHRRHPLDDAGNDRAEDDRVSELANDR
jgi:hypothetical protein